MFLIQIDFRALLEHLQDTGDAWDLETAAAWLRQQGFVEQQDGWLCDDGTLATLDRSEVISQRRV